MRKDFELERIAGNVLPPNDKNVRPGKRMGLTTPQVQNYIKRQKRCKGQNYTLSTGDNSDLVVQLPGDSRVMLGFVLDFSSKGNNTIPTGEMSLQINNEIMIDSVFVKFFGQDFTDEEYYFLPRPLSGQDDIRLSVKGVESTYNLHVNFYYL